jgi:hypothetical protein
MPPGATGDSEADSHWVNWHLAYDDEASSLSHRLRLVQVALRGALEEAPPGPVGIVSLCSGQGRDVIDVVAASPRRHDVRARLVELDPGLVAFSRARAADLGVGEQVDVIEGDAALASLYAALVPANVVLVCGVFGNISDEDIRSFVLGLPAWCVPGGSVIWTRHTRSPDLTPAVRGWFAEAGFEEVTFDAPEGRVLSVGWHRLRDGIVAKAYDPTAALFIFVGDGSLPA